jgi:hypothetical protein
MMIPKVCSGLRCGLRLPFVPVMELIDLGRVRMSMMFGVWTQGIRKWVPSPTGSARIPLNLSNIIARSPPSTANPTGYSNCSDGIRSGTQLRTVVQRRLQNTCTNAKADGIFHHPVEDPNQHVC